MSESNTGTEQYSMENEGAETYGSIEKAINGDYTFSIRATLSEAWDKTSGAKWPIHLAFLYYFLVMLAIVIVGVIASVALTTAPAIGDPSDSFAMNLLVQIGINLIALPMMAGIIMMGIQRSVNAPINANSVFMYFSKMFNLFLTLIIMYIMITIGFILLILPGIYLAVAYYMALPLVVEKGMSPWQALETSRKAVSRRWFRIFGFFIVVSIIMAISIIPLGIGLIWSLPLFIIAYGIIYRNMFGVEASTIGSME